VLRLLKGLRPSSAMGLPLVEGAEEFALVRDFAIIMAVAGGVVVLFRKLNQPPILGYLIAGLLIGPFTFPRPPITNLESIRLLADLGLVLLLFAVGLEFGWRRIRQVGLGVLFIGGLEMLIMISLGYWVGRLLGWTVQESIFLGAALSISSSAILVKVLQDTGRLTSLSGQLIVGILVVEDFAAVLLLTLLSGIATTGTAGLSDVGLLVTKLAIFAVASLALGALFVPRIIKFVGQFRSRETLLLASLALCFTLALLGQSLGISAAAGAFLIGTVIGDTDESSQITRIIEPIRDMFAALFFVSIGMLIDIGLMKDHLLPAFIVSAVFIGGKVLANTAGTFVAGQGGKVSLQVGMGKPQIGEFSLAMMKIGAEQEAVRAFLYQVMVGVTAITSLVYPYIVRADDQVADFLQRRSPRILRRSVTNLSAALQAFRRSLSFDSEFAHRIGRASIPIAINFLIIVVLVGTGTLAVRFAMEIAGPFNLSKGIVGNIIGFATLMLCLPSAIALWRGLQHLSDEATSYLVLRRGVFRVRTLERLRNVMRDSILVLLVIVIGLWSIPLMLELLTLGSLATAPLPLATLAVLGFLTFQILARMHRQLMTAFGQTFLGGANSPEGRAPEQMLDPHVEVPLTDEGQMAPLPVPGYASDRGEVSGPAVSLGQAEIVALSTVSKARSPYKGHLREKDLVWDIKESVQAQDYYKITLTFRESSAAAEDVGEEQLYIDQQGKVRLRQILSWPSQRVRRPARLLLFSILSAFLILGLGAGVYALIQWGPMLAGPGG
jgi:monovalent cation:H+ antiporter-2, CPA2 family